MRCSAASFRCRACWLGSLPDFVSDNGSEAISACNQYREPGSPRRPDTMPSFLAAWMILLKTPLTGRLGSRTVFEDLVIPFLLYSPLQRSLPYILQGREQSKSKPHLNRA